MRPLLMPAVLLAALSVAPRAAHAAATAVEHERSAATSGTPAAPCPPFVSVLRPTARDAVTVRFRVLYAGQTSRSAVYYTTDGSNPSGAFGVGKRGTRVLTGAYSCAFQQKKNAILVEQATLPALPRGTTVKYIIGAWHGGGGPEVFANPGRKGQACNTAACATVFSYRVR